MDKIKPLAILLILAFFLVPVNAGEWGYMSAYQGLEITFDSIRWNGYIYTETNRGPNPNYEMLMSRGGVFWTVEDETASSAWFKDRLNWDPDLAGDGKPNICGSSNPVSVDTTVEPKQWTWNITYPAETYNATHEGDAYTVTTQLTRQFKMYRFKCDWSLNLWLSGDHLEAYPHDYTHYNDVQIIMKLTPRNFLYFNDNPSQLYIAPAYISLNNIEWTNPVVGEYQSIYPGSRGETLGILYNREGHTEITETKLLTYQDMELDPKVFRNEYYLRIGLDTFMPYTKWGMFRTDWFEQMPSITLNFQVYIFVVGEWQVRLETWEKIPLETHTPQQRDPPVVIPYVEQSSFPELMWYIRIFFATVFIGLIATLTSKFMKHIKKP